MSQRDKWMSLAGDPVEGPNGWYDRANKVAPFNNDWDYFKTPPSRRTSDDEGAGGGASSSDDPPVEPPEAPSP